MLNHIELIGRLTRDPEMRFTQSGITRVNFTLAVDRRYKSEGGERETDFIDIICWRKTAENCNQYLHKGSMCAVEGSLQIRKYQAKDGSNRVATEVNADNVVFLSRDGKSDNGGGRPAPTPKPQDDDRPDWGNEPPANGFDYENGTYGDNELPF